MSIFSPMVDTIRNMTLDKEARPVIRQVPADEPPPIVPRPAPTGPQDLESARARLAELRTRQEQIRRQIAELPPLKLTGGALSLAGGVDVVRRAQADVSALLDGKELARGDFAPLRDNLFREREAIATAIDTLVPKVAELEAAEVQSHYEAVDAPKLKKLDIEIGKALLKFRDLWESRCQAADKIRRPAGTGTRPQLAVRADLNQLAQALRAVKLDEMVR